MLESIIVPTAANTCTGIMVSAVSGAGKGSDDEKRKGKKDQQTDKGTWMVFSDNVPAVQPYSVIASC